MAIVDEIPYLLEEETLDNDHVLPETSSDTDHVIANDDVEESEQDNEELKAVKRNALRLAIARRSHLKRQPEIFAAASTAPQQSQDKFVPALSVGEWEEEEFLIRLSNKSKF